MLQSRLILDLIYIQMRGTFASRVSPENLATEEKIRMKKLALLDQKARKVFPLKSMEMKGDPSE